MASVKLVYYQHKKYKDGSHPIGIQLIKDRKRKFIGLGHAAFPAQWDFEDNLPNRKHPDYKRLKLLISQKIALAHKELLELENRNSPFTLEEWASKLLKKNSNRDFFSYAEGLIERLKKSGKIGNAGLYGSVTKIFKSHISRTELAFEDINYNRLKHFEEWLMEKECKKNTISVYLRTIRAIYYKAMREKAFNPQSNPFTEFKITEEKTVKRAISKEEITKIKTFGTTEINEFTKARDIFLFSFYTRGMSFIDIIFLKVSNIESGRLVFARKKTSQIFSIKLATEAMEIITRYSTLKNPDEFIFPHLRNSKNTYLEYRNVLRQTNKKLKKIGELTGINIPLTTYVARHSWATIAKRSGIPTAVISEGLGHDTEHTTQIYLDSFENDVLDKANELIIR